MAEQSYDVVVIGGGVIGSAIAYFLAAEPAFDGRILVAERAPAYTQSSTSLSVGGVRHQFSTEENIRMSLFGTEFLRRADAHLAVDDWVPDVAFRENGYLFLATRPGREILNRNHALQTRLGADIDLLSRSELAARFPWLNTDDLVAGGFGASGEGWLDPYALLQAFRRKARSLGVDYVEDEAVAIEREADRVTAVGLARTGRVACGAAVNAAGTGAARIAALAGIDGLPVHVRKRCVFLFEADGPGPDCPLTVDPSGVYFRPEGQQYLCGVGPDPDPDCDDFDVDADLFESILWPALAHRVPAFEALRPRAAWAGHYAYNTLDQNAILGPHPEVTNFYFANGFSGHGLQQSPAVGRYISERIAFGGARTLDLSAFAYERICQSRPVRELNVV